MLCLVLLVVSVGVGAYAAPTPPRLSTATTGDADLAAQVREAAGDGKGYRGISVALVDHSSLRLAGVGDSGNPARSRVDGTTVFEAGSIGKPMTGMLLATLADRKLLELQAPLDQLLPDVRFSDPTIAEATLEDLATHRAGLEKLPSTLTMKARDMRLRLLGQDPYSGLNEDDVLAAAQSATAISPGQYSYSNLGMALAGYTVARTTGRSYSELLHQYLFNPLGMRDSRIMDSGLPFPEKVAHGQQATGPATQHWLASGYTPAGDIWTTSQDLGRFLRAVIQGTAPGARAAEPTHDAGFEARTGLGWFTSTVGGRDITWQNGATGGFTSYIAFDRDSRRGVVVLANTDRSVDTIGRQLLGLPADRSDKDAIWALGTGAGLVGATLPALVVGLRQRTGSAGPALLTIDLTFGVVILALTWRLGDWLTLPPALWTLSAGLLALGLLLGATRRDTRVAGAERAPARVIARTAGRAVIIRTGLLAALFTTLL